MNKKLANEIHDKDAIVKEAVAAKRKIDLAEKSSAAAARSLEEERETIKRVRTEKKRAVNLLRHQRNQTANLRERVSDTENVDELKAGLEELSEDFDKLKDENKDLRAELAEKDAEIDKLRDAIEPVIQTKESSGDYTTSFRRLIYKLLCKNIPQANINSTISDVLDELAHKEASDLPTEMTIRKMNMERLAVAQHHVAVCAGH